jgi:hypothetical protein
MFKTFKTDMTPFLWVILAFGVCPCHLVYNVFSFRATSTSCLNHPKDGDHGVSQNIGSTQRTLRLNPKNWNYTLQKEWKNLRV